MRIHRHARWRKKKCKSKKHNVIRCFFTFSSFFHLFWTRRELFIANMLKHHLFNSRFYWQKLQNLNPFNVPCSLNHLQSFDVDESSTDSTRHIILYLIKNSKNELSYMMEYWLPRKTAGNREFEKKTTCCIWSERWVFFFKVIN